MELRAKLLCPNIYTLEMLWQNTSVIQSHKQREFYLGLRTAAGRDQHRERVRACPSSSILIPKKHPCCTKATDIRCTWALPLSIFHTSPFCLHFGFFSSFSPGTAFIFRITKNFNKTHHSLTPRPIALHTEVADTASNNSVNKPRPQRCVMQYWISRHNNYTFLLLTHISLHFFS